MTLCKQLEVAKIKSLLVLSELFCILTFIFEVAFHYVAASFFKNPAGHLKSVIKSGIFRNPVKGFESSSLFVFGAKNDSFKSSLLYSR